MMFYSQISIAKNAITYDSALLLKKNGEYFEAEKEFLFLVNKDQDNGELWYQLGVVQRYQGKLKEDMESQKKAIKFLSNNPDIKLELARLYNWDNKFDEAEELVNEVIAQYPHYEDAKLLKKSIDSNKLNATKSPRNKWIIGGGYEKSTFSKSYQPARTTEFIDIANWVSKDTILSLYGERQERDKIDRYYRLSAGHIFNDDFNAKLSVGHTPNANFSVKWRFEVLADLRIIHNHDKIGDTWLTMDVQHSQYQDVSDTVFETGLKYKINDYLNIHPKSIIVMDSAGDSIYGWSIRSDWQTPLPQLRLFGGLSDSPEYDEEKIVHTCAYFIGGSVDIISGVAVNAAYTREDRDDSYIRKIMSISLSVKF